MATIDNLVGEIAGLLSRYEDPDDAALLASEAARDIINRVLAYERARVAKAAEICVAANTPPRRIRWDGMENLPDGGQIVGMPLEAK